MYKILGTDQRVYGPTDVGELRRWIAEGRANAQSQIQVEGASEWRALGTFPEFAADLAITAPVILAPLPAMSMGSRASAGTNGMAMAGFIFGLLSVPNFCCCCLTPCAILGIIFSCIGLSQTKQNPMQGGRSLAIIGIILSIVGLSLWVIWTIFVITNAAINPSALP